MTSSLIERLDAMLRRFDEIEAELANPAGAFDQARYTALVKERAKLEETVETYRRLSRTQRRDRGKRSAGCASSDPELRELAEEELEVLRARASASSKSGCRS